MNNILPILEAVYKTNNISDDEIRSACDLVNQGGQLSITLTAERLRETHFLVVVILQGDVVGVSCIKNDHEIAEIGYTAVCPKHRRQKIGQKMTELLVRYAQTQNIMMLCGIVYRANVANRKKLEKIGFFKMTEFLSKSGEKTLCWYCHPLLQSKNKAKIMMNNFLVERAKVRASARSSF